MKDVMKEILTIIENNPKITIPEIAETLHLTGRTIARQIGKLKKEKILARDGGRKNGIWVIFGDKERATEK
jgi:ATP-dependent DNA helicase RecG